MVARPAVRVEDVPVDAGAVRGGVVGEGRRAAVTRFAVLYERRQSRTLGHAFRADRTTDEVVPVVAVVLRQIHAAVSHTHIYSISAPNFVKARRLGVSPFPPLNPFFLYSNHCPFSIQLVNKASC